MPGVVNTKNSSMTVAITDDPEKGKALCEKYKLLKWYLYENFDQALKEALFDALYIATPNFRHAEFTIPALEHGYHVLLEKPMETSEEGCRAILAAQQKTGAKLMVAYRLHCEPTTVEIINRVRSGDLGDPRIFNSVFTQSVSPSNHRYKNGFDAGPIPDMGTYPINAVRNIFAMEPIEVYAVGSKNPEFDTDFSDTVSVTLKFPSSRIATFTVSYSTSGTNQFTVVGANGSIECNPSYMFGPDIAISYSSVINGKAESHKGKVLDQFAGEASYFSGCIINDMKPEPDGDEAWRDVRIICAIKRALETGQVQQLEPLASRRHPTFGQSNDISFPLLGGGSPAKVHCESPSS